MKDLPEIINFGDRLKEKLAGVIRAENLVILSLSERAIPISEYLSRATDSPHLLFPVKKLTTPGVPKFSIAAITLDKEYWINDDLKLALGISDKKMSDCLSMLSKEATEIAEHHNQTIEPDSLNNKNIVLVDHRMTTGAGVMAAVKSMRQREVRSISVAVPFCNQESIQLVSRYVNRSVYLEKLSFYASFSAA